ncbi:MAG: DEAD/DEAH box helicase family protein [Saprospiraceae bacterium]
MSNFKFLQDEWRSLYRNCKKAESRIRTEPVSAARYGRVIMEEVVYEIYAQNRLEFPYNKDLANLVQQADFKEIVSQRYFSGLKIIRLTGNNASHYGRSVDTKAALTSIRYLFDFLKWFANDYSVEAPKLPVHFDEQYIPKIGAEKRKLKAQQAEAARAQQELADKLAASEKERAALLAKAQESEATLTAYQAEIAAAKAATEARAAARPTPVGTEFTEAETRKHLINADLHAAGWTDLQAGRHLEYPVQGMPITRDNPRGNGFVDYVLWDDNGKPLALIEAKRTNKSVEAGKHQAFLYANCLEEMHGQRPLIFYTNGYETKLWDDIFYSAPRRVHGFYTKDELQWAIQQRGSRADLRKAVVNEAIAGRPYQMEAIQRIAESLVVTGSKNELRGNQRSVLLVMATGSGKTRTAAALTEILFKHNWAKRVLFLADRNALVTQAKNRFSEFLPHLSAIDLTKEKENDTTRLVFSTYPSMMKRIDSVDIPLSKEHPPNPLRRGEFYGVGHFDAIIVDEAHRSVYNRYQAIFDYFDALVIGLTATPKDQIDRNTFELFGCSTDDPTFSYELDTAVEDGFLTQYQNVDVSTEFLRKGIKYSQLSAKEKEAYEAQFLDDAQGLFPEEISASAINKWLFNTDTVNKVLDTLMQEGQRIEGGDKLGRTIIFAVNQKHAEFIVQCFESRYPELPAGFIAMIHNQVSHAQSLIEAFCDERVEEMPQIAVSVDMMDTGIDAPRVLNLVFFKVVRSYAKFWQMIGRGTRLCPDVFGPEQAKEYFLIFDVCQNFEFFDINKKGKETANIKSIRQRTFEARLQLSRLLAETGEVENIELAHALLDQLHADVLQLKKEQDRFQVKMNLRYVDAYAKRERWNNLTSEDVHLIETYLAPLPASEAVSEAARRFELMMLKMQIAKLLELSQERKYQDNLIAIATELSGKYTIPAVVQRKELIEQLKEPDFYKNLQQKRLDEIRVEIKEIVEYLERRKRNPVYLNIEDSEVTMTVGEPLPAYGSGIYKKRVERFLRENKQHITIKKLSNNIPITPQELNELERLLFDGDERGTKEEFQQQFGEQPLGAFVRSIIGLKVEAAQRAFAEFLQTGNLRADQMTFVNNIIQFLTQNGTIEPKMLFESPFTDAHDEGLIGVFGDGRAQRIMQIVREVNENAAVG